MLAPIEAIKDLLTGNIWDKFKEMIEPYAVINSIILITLNLALVYPALGSLAENPFFTALGNASDGWKLAIGTVFLFVLSFIINNLSTFGLDFASGEVLRESPWIGKTLLKRQRKHYDKYDKAFSDKTNKDEIRNQSAFHLAYEFPVKENELGLTRLGNLLQSPASYVYHQYGVSLKLAWPIISKDLKDDDKGIKSIQGNWTSLLFFTSLYTIIIFIIMELIFISAIGGEALNIWSVLILLVFAAVCYSTSLVKARSWGEGMREIFDLHIRELYLGLGLEGLKDLTPHDAEFKENWADVFSWLAYGALPLDKKYSKEEWYAPKSNPSVETWPKLKHPMFLQVEALPRLIKNEGFLKKIGRDNIYFNKTVEYFFALTNSSSGEEQLPGKEVYFLVQDIGVTLPEEVPASLSGFGKDNKPPAFTDVTVIGRKQAGKPAGLLFPLGEISPGSSKVLKYSFNSALAKIDTSLKIGDIKSGANASIDFLDFYLEQDAQKGFLGVELLDDEGLILKGRVELFPSLEGTYPPEKEISTDNRKGKWVLDIPEKTEKIRVFLSQAS